MKTKLLLSIFAVSLCSVLFSSCSEEQIVPKDVDERAQKGVQLSDGF